MAKIADTAAATIPRGAIHASSARSRQPRLDPAVLSSTFRGRAMNWMISSSMSTSGPSPIIAFRSSRAASRMNRPEISRTLRFSLKCRMCRTSTPFMLASHMPMSVTASNPDSCVTALDAIKIPRTAASAARLCRYSGSHWRRIRVPSNQPPKIPKRLPHRITPPKVSKLSLMPLPSVLAMMKL
ncbi:hypothetical protein D3C80_1119260 [compost metagenome]